jgi:hypothetical protein
VGAVLLLIIYRVLVGRTSGGRHIDRAA